MAPTNGNGNGNGRVSRWIFGVVLSVLLAVLGWLGVWQVTAVEATASHLATHMAKQAEDERGYAERLRAVETDVRWIRDYLERQGREMIGVTTAIIFAGLCVVGVGLMLERALDDLADNGLFIPAGDVEADIKSDPPGWPHVDEEHWRGCPICQAKKREETK